MVQLVLTNEGIDEKADGHPSRSSHHGLAATDILYNPESDNSGRNVDSAENDRGNIGVAETSG